MPQTKSIGRAFRRFFNVAHTIGYSPYKYDTTREELTFVDKKIFRWTFYGNLALVLIYETFLVIRYIQTVQREDSTMRDKLTGFFYPTLYIALNLNYYIRWKTWGTAHHLFNQSIQTSQEIRETLQTGITTRREKDEEKYFARKISKYINIALFLIISSAILRGGKVLKAPQSSELISSALTDYKGTVNIPLWAKLLFTFVQLNVTGFVGYTFVCWTIHCLMYGLFASASLKHLRYNEDLAPAGSRSLSTISRFYHRLQVQQSVYNETYCLWPLMCEVCAMFMIVIRLFLAVIFSDIRNFIGGLSVLLGLCITFEKFGQLNEICLGTLTSWGTLSEPWFRRYRMSVRPLRISMGGFYYVDKCLVLTILAIVVDNVTSLVIGYRDA